MSAWARHLAETPRVERCGCGRVLDDSCPTAPCPRCDLRLAEALMEAVRAEIDPADDLPEDALALMPAVIEAARLVHEAEARLRWVP